MASNISSLYVWNVAARIKFLNRFWVLFDDFYFEALAFDFAQVKPTCKTYFKDLSIVTPSFGFYSSWRELAVELFYIRLLLQTCSSLNPGIKFEPDFNHQNQEGAHAAKAFSIFWIRATS